MPIMLLLTIRERAALKPCPFCGATAEPGQDEDSGLELRNTWTAAYWIQCNECSAQVDGNVAPNADPNSEADHVFSKLSAIENWNTRVEG